MGRDGSGADGFCALTRSDLTHSLDVAIFESWRMFGYGDRLVGRPVADLYLLASRRAGVAAAADLEMSASTSDLSISTILSKDNDADSATDSQTSSVTSVDGQYSKMVPSSLGSSSTQTAEHALG